MTENMNIQVIIYFGKQSELKASPNFRHISVRRGAVGTATTTLKGSAPGGRVRRLNKKCRFYVSKSFKITCFAEDFGWPKPAGLGFQHSTHTGY